ncbi:MAG: hypothetical protein NUV35_08180 [Syntrophomonadaceae bacterium]|nr:hypothetical protein [Syntrophomonadaceae bacterium]
MLEIHTEAHRNEGSRRYSLAVPANPSELQWWEEMNAGVFTFFAVETASGRSGALYCREFIHPRHARHYDQDCVITVAHPASQLFALATGLARLLAQQYPQAHVSVGYRTGLYQGHELCVVMPCHTPACGWAEEIDRLLHDQASFPAAAVASL